MSANIAEATRRYRQAALTIASKNDSEIAKYVSNALLRQHDGLHSVRDDGVSSSSMEGTCLPTCPRCGGPVQPGCEGVSIRLLRQKSLSRSQRRRLSRKTALIHKRAKAKHIQKESSELSLLGKVIVTEYPHLQKQTSMRHTLSHELQASRNLAVVKCQCQWKLTLPGCPRNKSTYKGQTVEKGGTKGRVSVPERRVVSHKNAKDFSQQNDFIAIGKLPKRKANNNGNDMKETMRAGKKKKPKKSQLMDFLSSLNDR
ncbi:hypothetical protein FisN_3Lh445 [Fistulifera solaris]|uniref:Uncharacterized protein n=1 Tax=Fistulifera solaris TaxID=1519565 RepID=A0A1Z5J8B6_FISSO|nr:hypothetical protein FisN_3Lh445 [Fistulifera solaris]|eukprot:GAX10244.1 hypothetical protein FisN_3Lh445 [Fistulifera solaris]